MVLSFNEFLKRKFPDIFDDDPDIFDDTINNKKDIIKYGDLTGHDECFHKDSTHPETIFLDSYGRLSVGLYNYEKGCYISK